MAAVQRAPSSDVLSESVAGSATWRPYGLTEAKTETPRKERPAEAQERRGMEYTRDGRKYNASYAMLGYDTWRCFDGIEGKLFRKFFGNRRVQNGGGAVAPFPDGPHTG